MSKPLQHYFDVLIIGSGAAGLGLALSVADNAQVAIISKDNLAAGSSQHAQGGIAAVMSQDDSYAEHIQDTLNAGAGLCDPSVVEFTVKNAKNAITWLVDHGVKFTLNKDKNLHLTKEGGHSQRRIVHAADCTGAAVIGTLADQVKVHPNIHCFDAHTAIDLILQDGECVGAWVLDNNQLHIEAFTAAQTIIATGGASSVYLHTSNPDFNSGDGIAMAYRAGANISNMEFNQFHPTCLYHPDARSFLISEAVRGEGGQLILPNGERFMPKYDARAELAPRDIVARAIDHEMKLRHLDCVYLDITHLKADKIKKFFPTIYQECLKYHIDITQVPIPVVPAAHYTCGGIKTNLQGQTNIKNLYAIGETSCTGLHGANRMASNSLLECLVFAASSAQAISKNLHKSPTALKLTARINYNKNSHINIAYLVLEIRKTMWQYVGIVRTNQSLQSASQKISQLEAYLNQDNDARLTKPLLECRNLLCVAKLIIQSAYQRKESRGLHYNLDYPDQLSTLQDTELLVNSVL